MAKKPKIGLALGAGGARGLAHVGVLKALERAGLVPDFIVGSSIGALVGAAYAVNPDAAALEDRVADVLGPNGPPNAGLKLLGKVNRGKGNKPDLFHRMAEFFTKEMFLNIILVRKALLSEKDLRECVTPFLGDIVLSETRIPFAVAAVDLVSGRKVVLKQGALIPAVMASCAVPGFMPPICIDGAQLVDGGVIDQVPSAIAKEQGAKVIIGVDVGSCPCRPAVIQDGVDSIDRASEIMMFYLSRPGRELADVLIEPQVRQFEWTDFSRYQDLIREGEKAAESRIDEIRKRAELRFRKRLFQRIKTALPRPLKTEGAKKVSPPPTDASGPEILQLEREHSNIVA